MSKENLILGAILIAVVSVFGYRYYTTTPEYIALQHYKVGVAALESKQFDQGIDSLGQALNSQTSVSGDAKSALNGLLQTSYLDALSMEESVQVLRLIYPLRDINAGYAQTVDARFQKYADDSPYIAGQLALLAANTVVDEAVALDYKQKAYALLQPQIDLMKKDKALAMDFALLDEEVNACGLCAEVLENFRNDLGDHEAARALGQYYANAGDVEAAFQLLKPYTESRLAAYHAAEDLYNASLDKIWNDAIEHLNSGSAPDSFYDSYDKANEVEKSELVNQYYSGRLEKSNEAQQALAKYQEAAAIVPVALDLGIVRLGRAMSMTDPAEQKAELAEAESMFLAVKTFAGESDDYQLYLGQVYYWLGKADEGDELFTALIDKYNRSDAVLSSIAGVLRDLGAKAKATEYIDEAYKKAETKENKQAYAYQRYLLTSTLDERIEWLEKCNQTSAFVKADLFSAKAAKAALVNDKKLADGFYQKAIDSYLTLPESASLYNNVALIYMSKFELGRNEADYDNALHNMDMAVQIASDDSIVLSNAADSYAVRTYRDILAKEINFSVLHFTPSLDLFSYLYDNREQKLNYIEKIKSSDSYGKMMEYLKKASLLAPKDPQVFSGTYYTYNFLRLDEDIKNLATRLETIGLETQGSDEKQQKYRSGESDTESLESIHESIETLSKRYASLDKNKYPFESVVVDATLIDLHLSLARLGEKVDVNTLLKKAEKNLKKYPSSSTRSQYLNVLLQLLLDESRKESAEFNEFYQEYKRIYEAEYIVALALSGIDTYKQKIQQSDTFKNYIDTVIASNSKFPGRPSVREWYLLNAIGHEYASEIKEQYLNYDIRHHILKIASGVSVNKEVIGLQHIFELLISGDNEGAQKLLKEGRDEGLQLPDII